jgi:SAM-dependent methyltransferase
VNLDVSANVGADVVHDLHQTPLPFADESFDCIYGSHVFEHIEQAALVPLVRDLVRMLKVGGYLIAVTPYGSSSDHWENPFHRQAFSELTWAYFDKRLYQQPGNAGYADFGIDFDLKPVEVHLVPYPEFKGDSDEQLEFKKCHWRNVIQEVQAVMQRGS